jgi:hypothetical protein
MYSAGTTGARGRAKGQKEGELSSEGPKLRRKNVIYDNEKRSKHITI